MLFLMSPMTRTSVRGNLVTVPHLDYCNTAHSWSSRIMECTDIQLTGIMMFATQLSICQNQCHWTAEHEELTDVELELVDNSIRSAVSEIRMSTGTSVSRFSAVGSWVWQVWVTGFYEGCTAAVTAHWSRVVRRPTENVVAKKRADSICHYTHLHTNTSTSITQHSSHQSVLILLISGKKNFTKN